MVHDGCVFVASIHPSRTWMSGSFESVRWNACMHRVDLGLYSQPKEINSKDFAFSHSCVALYQVKVTQSQTSIKMESSTISIILPHFNKFGLYPSEHMQAVQFYSKATDISVECLLKPHFHVISGCITCVTSTSHQHHWSVVQCEKNWTQQVLL